nr:LysR family substrate-binding domain-containing protein [Nocardiopsis mwathae]
MAASDTTTFRVGIGSAVGQRLDDFLDALTTASNGACFEFQTLPARTRLEQLRAGRLDAAFIRGIDSAPGLRLLPLWCDPMVVALPASHPRAAESRLDLADLAELPLLVASRTANPVLFETVTAACRKAGFEPTVGPPSTGLQDTLAGISAGTPGWTPIYPTAVNAVSSRRVMVLPLDGDPITIRMSLALREDADPNLMELLATASAQLRDTIAREGETCAELTPEVSGSNEIRT